MYFDQGALTNYIFIDPGWLCQDVLGKALAPESFPVAKIASIGFAQISEDTLQAKFAEHIDKKDIPAIINLLQHFDLCYRKDNAIYEFPAFIKDQIESEWKPQSNYIRYSGRHLVCAEESDFFPPGFFSRLQVLMSRTLKTEKILHFKGSFIIDALHYQCLIQINHSSTAISIIGRAEVSHVHPCIQLLDQIQSQIASLIRDACPTIFVNLMIPSSSDLKLHYVQPHYYSIYELVDKERMTVVNRVTNVQETVADLLYLGSEEFQSKRHTKVAYIPMDIILDIQDLLKDDDNVSSMLK